MPDAVEMVAQRLRLRAGADNEHIARVQPAVKAPIEKYAIDEPPQPRGDCNQDDRADHDAARDVVGAHQVKRAGEQQARSETCLRTESLLVQEVGEALRRVQVHRRLVTTSVKLKPHSRASNIHMERP
jgi:hypothetical protein